LTNFPLLGCPDKSKLAGKENGSLHKARVMIFYAKLIKNSIRILKVEMTAIFNSFYVYFYFLIRSRLPQHPPFLFFSPPTLLTSSSFKFHVVDELLQ
jgi:hypothetical protein